MLTQISEFFAIQIISFGGISLEVGDLIILAIIIFGTKLINNLTSKFIFYRAPEDLKKYKGAGRLHSIVQLKSYVINIFAFVIILNSIGVNIGIIIASSTALFVGLGLGLQSTFNDFMSGIILLFEGTLQIGDVIEVPPSGPVGGEEIGKVTKIGLRTSEIITPLGVTMVIPNSQLTSEKIINWSHDKKSTGVIIEVGVAYGSDLEKIKKILNELADKFEHIEKDPKPQILLKNFGDSSIDIHFRFWVEDTFRQELIKSDVRYEIEKLFRENNIQIPFPQRVVYMHNAK